MKLPAFLRRKRRPERATTELKGRIIQALHDTYGTAVPLPRGAVSNIARQAGCSQPYARRVVFDYLGIPYER